MARALGMRRSMLDAVRTLVATHGPVVGLRAFGARACIVTCPKQIDALLVGHHRSLRKWDVGQFAPVLGRGLLTSEGMLWRQQRRLTQPHFVPSSRVISRLAIDVATSRMIEQWREGQVVDVRTPLLALTNELACRFVFGDDAACAMEPCRNATTHVMAHFARGLAGVLLPLWVPTPSAVLTRRAVARLRATVQEIMERRRSTNPTRGDETTNDNASRHRTSDDFLGGMLAARDPKGAPLDDALVVDECINVLLAAHDTTATALTWTVSLLAAHPETADWVTTALDRTNDPRSCPELTMVIRESLRLYPPVWGMGRITTEEVDLGEHHLPAGTHVFILPYLAHHDRAYDPDPLSFRPQRWLEGDAKPPTRGRHGASFIAFGHGPRKCAGARLATMELSFVLAQVLKRVSLRPAGKAPPVRASVTLQPAGPLWLRVARRTSPGAISPAANRAAPSARTTPPNRACPWRGPRTPAPAARDDGWPATRD